MLPGETIHTGANPRCNECKRWARYDVYCSNAGWYIGTYCDCGPYSRESGYFSSEEQARAAFDSNKYQRR